MFTNLIIIMMTIILKVTRFILLTITSPITIMITTTTTIITPMNIHFILIIITTGKKSLLDTNNKNLCYSLHKIKEYITFALHKIVVIWKINLSK